MRSKRLYNVKVERNGRGWRVEVPGMGRLFAHRLAEVEPTARKLVWATAGVPPADIELDVAVRLPTVIQLRLNLADQLCEEATMEVEGAITNLVDLGVSAVDVEAILRHRRHREGPRFLPDDDGVLELWWRASA